MSLKSSTRQAGINVFLYLHPNRRWTTPPADIPSADPGQLRQKTIGLEPNGNVVCSYLELIAPDNLEIAVIRRHLLAFLDRAQFGPMPWKGVDGPCGVALQMVPELVRVGWAREFGALAGAGQQLLDDARLAVGSVATLGTHPTTRCLRSRPAVVCRSCTSAGYADSGPLRSRRRLRARSRAVGGRRA